MSAAPTEPLPQEGPPSAGPLSAQQRRGLTAAELRSATLACALTVLATCWVQGAPVPGAIEVLEGAAHGTAGVPWWRLRALSLAALSPLPFGSFAARLELAAALMHGALAAVICVRTARLLRVHAAHVAPKLSPWCALLAALLAMSTQAAIAAACAPSSAALPAALWLGLLLARAEAAAFGCGLLCALDLPCGLLAALMLLARAPTAQLASVRDRGRQIAFFAGILPGLLLLVTPGRALYSFPLRAELLAAPPAPAALFAQLGWPLLICAALSVLPLARNAARRRALRERALLGALALLLACGSRYTSEVALLLLGALAAELCALWLWLGGAWLLAHKVPLSRAILTLTLALVCAWPLSRLDEERARAVPRAQAESALALAWRDTLADDALCLLHDGLSERALSAQQALAALSPRLSLYPLREAESVRAQRAIALDPALLPLARESLLDGTPAERTLVHLASQRPVLLEASAQTPRAVLKHLLPQGPWLRFDVEPRGASDRLLALRAQQALHTLAQAQQTHALPASRARLWATLERSAWSLYALRERDSSALAIELLRGYSPDSAVLRALLEADLSAARERKIEAIELAQ